MRTPPAVRVFERYLLEGRRSWLTQLANTALLPVGYLGALAGLGRAIDHGAGAAALGGASYAAFLAPGLLASTAMQVGAQDASWPVLTGFKWTRYFISAGNTELEPADLFDGMLLWTAARLGLSCVIFLAFITAVGLVHSPFAFGAVLVATLCGLAFTAPMAAWTATLHDEGQQLSLTFRMVIMPLFLFSGAFFPISQLPAVVRWVAYLTPTWHGVEACRMLVLGRVRPAVLATNVAYLAACTVAGIVIGHRTFATRIRGKA